MSQTLEEEVNMPIHYRTHESGIEAIEITRYLIGDLSNAWKYAMRYEDKNTPKKDIKKLCWYLNDFRDNFIDDNNVCQTDISVPRFIKEKMKTVIDTEPNNEVRDAFELIYSVVVENGLVNPQKYNDVLDELNAYSETLK